MLAIIIEGNLSDFYVFHFSSFTMSFTSCFALNGKAFKPREVTIDFFSLGNRQRYLAIISSIKSVKPSHERWLSVGLWDCQRLRGMA